VVSREVRDHLLAALCHWRKAINGSTSGTRSGSKDQDAEQDADAPSIIPLNSCLYIYFFFRFRRMLNRNALESLNEILFNRQQRNRYKNLNIQQRKYNRFVQTFFSDSLLFTQRKTFIPNLLIRRCVIVILVQSERDNKNNRMLMLRMR